MTEHLGRLLPNFGTHYHYYIRNIQSLNKFKAQIKTYLFKLAFNCFYNFSSSINLFLFISLFVIILSSACEHIQMEHALYKLLNYY